MQREKRDLIKRNNSSCSAPHLTVFNWPGGGREGERTTPCRAGSSPTPSGKGVLHLVPGAKLGGYSELKYDSSSQNDAFSEKVKVN